MDPVAQLAAAFAAGLLGSTHCLGMCAGISGLIAVNSGVRGLATQLPLALFYNVGRVSSYALLGAIVAASGAVLVTSLPLFAAPVRIAGGLVIILMGLQLAFQWPLLAPLERAGAKLWARIAPHATGFIPATTLPRAFALGLFWGWLPCGLVYSVLLLAAASAAPAQGALIMLAFGLGTVPAMTMTGIGALRLSGWLQKSTIRRAAGILLVAIGLLTIATPLGGLFDPHNHQGAPRIQQG